MEQIPMRPRTPRTSLEESPRSTITAAINKEWAEREIDSILPSPITPSSASTSRSGTSSMTDLNGQTACGTPYYGNGKEQVLIGVTEKLGKLPTAEVIELEDQIRVVELARRDDQDRWPTWKRRLNKLYPYTTFLALASYLNYFTFRVYFTVAASSVYKGNTFAMAWIFVATECLVAMPSIFHQVFALTAIRPRRRPKLRLQGDLNAPRVDIIITCCREDPDVVLDTLRAAMDMDWPADKLRIIVTDDGKDPEIEKTVNDLGKLAQNVYYFARVKVKGVPHHFKAGNLIAATAFSDSLPGGSAEFMACLDADMIPERHWLRTMLAPMIQDPKMGLTCPPQLFYNVPINDPLVQSLDAFVHVMEPVKDGAGVAWCTGSGYAIRRTGLDSIGGWPTGSLAEDTYTSSMLLGKGWKTAYIHEALQWGTVPESYASHLAQRTRWTLGCLETAVKLRFCLWGDKIKEMTFLQRLSGFIFTFDAFWKVFYVIALQTVPIVLISGRRMVAYANNEQLLWSLGFNLLAVFCNVLNEWIGFLPAGYRQGQREVLAMMWMSPYHAMTVVRSFMLPKWLGGKPMAFKPTGSFSSGNERNAEKRAPLAHRLKFILWDCRGFIHVFYASFCLAAITLSIVRAFTSTDGSRSGVLIYLLTHVAWPPLLIVRVLVACCVPLGYAIFPPNMPADREELLHRDPVTQVAHPREEFKRQRWNWWHSAHEALYWTLCSWTAVAFGLVYVHLH